MPDGVGAGDGIGVAVPEIPDTEIGGPTGVSVGPTTGTLGGAVGIDRLTGPGITDGVPDGGRPG